MKSMKEPSIAVFLSYASEDATAAMRVCAALRASGVEVWFDQSELRGGDVWDHTIRARIRDCALFIPIISRHTQERLEGYFRREWKLAVNRTHDMAEEKAFLVPIVIDDTKPQEGIVPEQFRSLQWTVAPHGELPAGFVERIAGLLAAHGRSPDGVNSTPPASAGRYDSTLKGAPPAPVAHSTVHPPLPGPNAAEHAASHSGGHRFPIVVPFLEGIKRRNVGRVAILYIVASYIVLEGFELFYHLLELPAWTGRLAVGLAVLGLPIVMVMAWAYEVTPEGLRPSDEVDPKRSIARQTGRRLDRAIIVVLFVALAYFAGDKFWLSKRMATTAAKTTAEEKTPAASAATTVIQTLDKSIAVLPFVDMSEKHDQEYFSDGLSEELIDHLAQSPTLHVISRTSCFYFKGKQATIGEIAKMLGVTHVLEGSVRKAGNELRITAQLIRASDGIHLWSQTYDRPLRDIFKLQDEIAGTVEKELEIAISKRPQAPGQGTPNPAAYDLVLKAQSDLHFTVEGFDKRIQYYRQAIALAPDYAAAWAGLANVLFAKEQLTGIEETKLLDKQASEAVARALTLDPNLPHAHVVLGLIREEAGDWDGAESEYDQANRLRPGSGDNRLVELRARKYGTLQESIDYYQKALLRDPLDTDYLTFLGQTLRDVGRFEDSAKAVRRVIELESDFGAVHYELARTLLHMGNAQEALAEAGRDPDELDTEMLQAMIYWTMGQRAEADAALKKFQSAVESNSSWANPVDVALIFSYRGDVNSAFTWLDRAFPDHKRDVYSMIKTDLDFAPLRSDGRYKAMLRKMNLPD
jgi:adenylate cyclase